MKHLEQGRWNYGSPEAWVMEPSHWQLVKEAEKLVELWKQKDLKARLGMDMDVILYMYK